jgi:hypothetical protein
LALHWSALLRVVEFKTLDHRFTRYANPAQASPDIILVAVDEPSLETFGRWPWPRDRHGYVVRYLQEAGARAIVFDILFFEPDTEDEVFDRDFAAQMLTAGNVFLPLLMESPTASSFRSRGLAALCQRRTAMPPPCPAQPARGTTGSPATVCRVKLPLPTLVVAARGLDLSISSPIVMARCVICLLVQTHEMTFVQLALAVARHVLGVHQAILTPHGLRLGSHRAVDSAGEMVINWHGAWSRKRIRHTPSVRSAILPDMQEGRPLLSPEVFRDKIVFIGATAAGTYDLEGDAAFSLHVRGPGPYDGARQYPPQPLPPSCTILGVRVDHPHPLFGDSLGLCSTRTRGKLGLILERQLLLWARRLCLHQVRPVA